MREQDYDERDMTRTQMDFLDLASRVDFDDFFLANMIESLRNSMSSRSIELADNILTTRRHNAVITGAVWILEGR
jgi:hypothetical protein